MPDLKLGPIPKVRYVRRNIRLSETLDEELTEYAAEYSQLHEAADVNELIPLMLEDFLRSDRGWRARRAKKARAGQRSKHDADGARRTDLES